MKRVIVAAVAAVVLAVPAVAQQRPAARDTVQQQMPGHQMSGHQMPAGGMRQGAAPMGQHQMPGMSGMSGMSGMQGGMPGCSMMGGDSAGGMMGGMMAAMATEPAHLLAMKADLRLTADQERRITAIRDAAQPGHDAAMRSGEVHSREMAQAMQVAAPDTAAVRAHFQAAHAAMGQANLAMLTAAARARAILTDAQRRQLDSVHGGMGQPQPAQPAHRH